MYLKALRRNDVMSRTVLQTNIEYCCPDCLDSAAVNIGHEVGKYILDVLGETVRGELFDDGKLHQSN